DGSFSQASYNPVGSYVKVFDLDPALRGKQVRICFEGVEQAMYLWLNGHFIGYAEDSFTPSEFLLTPYIREQGNVLAVEVHKRSTASYLEDQDFFRFFGIFRSVYLYAQPALHVEDMWAKPRLLEDNAAGSLELDIQLTAWGQAAVALCGENASALWVGKEESTAISGGQRTSSSGKERYSGSAVDKLGEAMSCPYQVRITLQDASGGLCWSMQLPAARSIHIEPQQIGAVTPWDSHNPYLYRLLITLLGPEGEILELVPYDIGFRRIEIVDKVIRLNGKRLIFNGVNRHEWSAKGGRVITAADMERDIRIFEDNNINAVRTCHYPDQIPWYCLCDSHGIYMISETNLETHGSWQKPEGDDPSWNIPGSFPAWREAVLDRARTHFETFKNHPAILMWSLGNESFAGENIAAMHALFKEKDPDRLVHYEGVVHNREYEDRISDVESQMYARPEDIAEYLSKNPKKPFILCEYMHDMGNSLGGMKSYIDLLDQFEMYQGGFI
ncbi:MAG: beta-galactosidase, partial [Acetatifactor sp.]|nr:beta-galactosidase [Acetatifactor sp.]